MKWVNNIIKIVIVRIKSQEKDISTSYTFMKLEDSYLNIDSYQASVYVAIKLKTVDEEKKR